MEKPVELTERLLAPSLRRRHRVWPVKWPRKYTVRVVLLAAAAVFAIAMLGIVVASLRTKDGTLVVEVDQPGATVEVRDGEGTILVTEASGGEPLVRDVHVAAAQTVEIDAAAALLAHQPASTPPGPSSNVATNERQPPSPSVPAASPEWQLPAGAPAPAIERSQCEAG